MPLLKYVSFVGTAVVTLLFGLNWLLAKPMSEPTNSGRDRPVIIRIASTEQLPERVIIDTSLPTIVPSPIQLNQQPPQAMLAATKPSPTPAIQSRSGDASKKQSLARREQKTALVEQHRRSNINPIQDYRVQAAVPVTRMSLLELIKERLGQSLFKLN
ncbi:hypothetical protein ACVWXM_002223 [Bradyrhizobium sp. GM7.3]|jgi:hypothetical protein